MSKDPSRGMGFDPAGKNFDVKKIIQWLSYILKCPICSHKYNLNNTKIVESEQDTLYNEARILIHSDCAKCKSSVMFNVEIRGPEVFSVGMVTDLTSYDSNKFKNKQPISANDVLTIHQEIRAFKGNLLELLTKK